VLSGETVDKQIGGLEDIVRSVQALPGVGRASDYHGEFFVRGAGSHANAVYLDGIPIFFPYHILGFNSIFNPGLVESAEFLAGGAPAAYAGATGGLLLVRSRGANPTPYRGNFGVSYIAGHVHAGAGGRERGWAVSLRRSYHDKLIRLLDRSSTSQVPSFYDAMLRTRWRPSPSHQLVAGVMVAGDGLSIPSPEASALRRDFIQAEAPGNGKQQQDSGFDTSDDRLDLHKRAGSRSACAFRSSATTTNRWTSTRAATRCGAIWPGSARSIECARASRRTGARRVGSCRPTRRFSTCD
jgi:hypothetical protein